MAYYDEIVRLLEERGHASSADAAVVMTVGTVKDEPPDRRERFELSREQEAATRRGSETPWILYAF